MKRIACVVVMTVGVGWAGAARAQEVDAAGSKRVELAGKVGMWMPMDDADDYADASLGVRVHGAYWVVPAFAIGGAVDFVAVNEEEEVADLTFYGIGITGLVTMPGPARVKPFGELGIGRYTIDSDDTDDAESDIGFRLGGGASFEMSPNLALLGEIAYSTVDFDLGLVSIDVASLAFEVGVAARL
jgi:opacity protein-like surface antigen